MEERYILTTKVDYMNLPARPLEEKAILLAMSVCALQGRYSVSLPEMVAFCELDPKRTERIFRTLAAHRLVMIVKPLT